MTDGAPEFSGRDFDLYLGHDVVQKVVRTDRSPEVVQQRERLLEHEHHVLVSLSKTRAAAHVPQAGTLARLPDGRLALTRPKVEGPSLAELVERALVRRRFQGARRWNAPTRAIAIALLDAVDALHRAGWVHNDLKPEDVLVQHDAGRFHVVLIDFGWAAPPGRSGSGGTLTWAAPERLEGRPGTEKSDVWALGALLYLMLTGRPPYPEGEDGLTNAVDAKLARNTPLSSPRDQAGIYAWRDLVRHGDEVGVDLARVLTAATDLSPKRRPSIATLRRRLGVARASTPNPHTPDAAPDAPIPTRPMRAAQWIGLGLAWLATAFAAVLAWQGLGADQTSCTNDCATAHTPGASIRGVPILAFAFGLHVTLWLVIGLRALATGSRSASLRHTLSSLMFGLTAILLVGTAVYLVWGLVLGLTCPRCLTLHTAALVAALGVFLAGLGEPVFARGTGTRVALGALSALLVMVSGTALGASHEPRGEHPTADLALLRDTDTCPAAAVFHTSQLPDVARLTASSSPTLLLWADFECAACRRELIAMRPLLQDLVVTQRAGLAVLLRAEVSACDPAARGGDPSRCEAPAAMICATRHGRPTSALAYLDWELGASPGYYTLEDRRTWLAQRVDPAARQCLDDELRLGRHGALARHADSARTLAQQAQTHAGCGSNQADPAWWCFAATPSMAVFSDTAPASPNVAARELTLGRLTGAARGRLLAACVGGP